MKKFLIFLIILIIFDKFIFSQNDEFDDLAFYYSITNTAEYKEKPQFIPLEYEEHDILQDIKVSLVEAIPFAFLYTFAGIFLYEAITQNTLTPKMKELKDYQSIYEISCGSFALINATINVLFFYDYNYKKPKKEEKK